MKLHQKIRTIIFSILAILFCQASLADSGSVITAALQKQLNSHPHGHIPIVIKYKSTRAVSGDSQRGSRQALILAEQEQVGFGSLHQHRREKAYQLYRQQYLDKNADVIGVANTLSNAGLLRDAKHHSLFNATTAQADNNGIVKLAEAASQNGAIESIDYDPEQRMVEPFRVRNYGRIRNTFSPSTQRVADEQIAWNVNYHRAIEAEKEFGITGEGIIVGVADTGIQVDHPVFGGVGNDRVILDMSDSFVNTENFIDDRNGHGTHCAGTVGGAPTNGFARFGMMPKVKFAIAKVLDGSGSGSWNSVMSGVEFLASKGVDVISMSLGGPESMNGNVVEDAVKAAIGLGIVVVIAAGNSGPSARTIGTPGVVEEAITVAAIDKNGKIARFSSRGPTRRFSLEKPDIAAGGVMIPSAWPGSGQNTISGTSMATPGVAGIVAAIIAMYRKKGILVEPAAVKNMLMANTLAGIPGEVNVTGAGHADCFAVLQTIDNLHQTGQLHEHSLILQ